jgi:ribonuclease G
VYKDPLGSKGARLTTQFTIPSRYLVLTPGIFQVAVSQKIIDDVEKERLLSLLTPSEQGGYIFRTAAEGITQAEIETDKEFLNTLWIELASRIPQMKAPALIYEEIPIVLRVLRDLVGYDVDKIQVDQSDAVREMRLFAKKYVPSLVERIEFYEGNQPIFDMYGVENELQKTLERYVPLKSGGHLVFDQTEAMTTIDVNTGSNVGHLNQEQTVFKTNLEAVEVIARQVRLRNLGGIIIIDFIDMPDLSHQTYLLDSLKTALAKDNAKTQVSELSSLGLVQMTRKRTQESLEHILCQPCPLCRRRGSIKSLKTICYEIFRELKRIAEHYPWAGFQVVTSPGVANELLHEESTMLADLEAELGKPIKLKADAAYVQEYYDIFPLDKD